MEAVVTHLVQEYKEWEKSVYVTYVAWIMRRSVGFFFCFFFTQSIIFS